MHIRPDDATLQEPFWRGLTDGKLLIQRCAVCGSYRHPPSPICATCLAFGEDWVAASGEATLYSFTVVEKAAHAALESWGPYVIALVELAEGVRLVSRLVGVEIPQVRVGMKLTCVIEQISPGFALPYFQPATSDTV